MSVTLKCCVVYCRPRGILFLSTYPLPHLITGLSSDGSSVSRRYSSLKRMLKKSHLLKRFLCQSATMKLNLRKSIQCVLIYGLLLVRSSSYGIPLKQSPNQHDAILTPPPQTRTQTHYPERTLPRSEPDHSPAPRFQSASLPPQPHPQTPYSTPGKSALA